MKNTPPITLFFIFGLVMISSAQSGKWKFGRITLLDNSVEEGKLYYDVDKEELHALVGNLEKIYKARHIHSFEIESRDSSKIYYALPFDLSEKNAPPVFFQLLAELPDFLLLAKKAPKVVYAVSSAGRSHSYTPEILYFLTGEGKVEIYATSVPNETKSTGPFMKEKIKTANIDLLRNLTDSYFDELQSFASARELNFENKDDLVKILNYYRTLIQ